MTRIGLILYFLCVALFCNAQLINNKSLIINGGFETFIDTPGCMIGLNGLFHWYLPTLQNGVVYSHKIVNNKYPNMNCLSSIQNGYEPHQGDGMMLVGLYAPPILPYYWARRMYIAEELSSELEKDSLYCFVVYINFLYRMNFSSIYTTNKFGAYFSIDSITDYSFPSGVNNLNVNPQLETDSDFIFIDSLNWVYFKKYYKASGGEKYITLGNFRDDANTPLFLLSDTLFSENAGIYIYIDDIGLYKNECPAETDTTQPPKPKVFSSLQIPSAFTPNNDGKNDVFRVLGSPQVSNFKLCVYNRWGKQVYCGNTIYDGWDGNCNGTPCEMATYQWVATYTDVLSGEQRVERGNVTLIR